MRWLIRDEGTLLKRPLRDLWGGTSIPPAPYAPSVLTPPTITQNGNILTRTAGTARGRPAPDLGIVWRLDGADIPGETSRTLDTGGTFGRYTTVDNWTNTEGAASRESHAIIIDETGQPGGDLDFDYVPDGSLRLAGVTLEGGVLTLTFEGSGDYAGTYTADVADYATGPVFLKGASVTGNAVHGAVLTGRRGLITYDGDSTGRVVTTQWLRDGSPIAGATGETYTINIATDANSSLTYQVTATDSHGSRVSVSDPVSVLGADDVPADTFTVSVVTPLTAYIGESNIGWRTTTSRFEANPAGFVRSVYAGFHERLDEVLPDQFSEVVIQGPADTAITEGLKEVGPAVCISDINIGYYAVFDGMHRVALYRRNSTNTVLWRTAVEQPIAGDHIIRLEHRAGGILSVYLDSVLLNTITDPNPLPHGKVGLGATSSNKQTSNYAQGITSFHGGSL